MLLLMILTFLVSCREVLVSSADEKMETLIRGQWVLQNSVPPRTDDIYFSFNSDLTVNIVDVTPDSTYELLYTYRIEDGDLHLVIVWDRQEYEYVYDIETLTPFELILSFTDGAGIRHVQTYVRP